MVRDNKKLSMLDRIVQAEEDEKRLTGKVDVKEQTDSPLKENQFVQNVQNQNPALGEETIRGVLSAEKNKTTQEVENRVKVSLKTDKSLKNYAVVRVREVEHNLFKKLKFNHKISFHDLMSRIIENIPKERIKKEIVDISSDDNFLFSNMKIYDTDHEVIKSISFKTGLAQYEVVAIYCAIAEFTK